ncbi:ABC transporter ATP-binding protein [Aureibacillus halotolerans]|uniref:Quaternary amine transport ATP-binding protein n=1 Tax=Aureibacillus halotolerans TaxID=1508390 RepID=A0A4R6U591_9BACI|nr:ABC transporter ATP-binding protein [Aureibacillus halotolerans]TDQ39769.1 osmoprotectant transport system ATP-binding protein [Aureibacillus halotolerans]
MITFSSISKRYDKGPNALTNINFTVEPGEIFVLIGPSGCGKTTTLKMVNRLIEPTSGEIKIKGTPLQQYSIDELRWNIGYVLQQIALFPHMTIAQNISIVPEMKKWTPKRIKKRTDELLNMVGLEPSEYRDRRPSALSGGQQQRVGVIRALAADPDIVLMDEPFSALDPISRNQLQNDILEIQKKIRKTILFVTHDIDEAMKIANRICIMKDGEIVQIGTPDELLNHPANDFVSTFVNQSSMQKRSMSTVAELSSLSMEYVLLEEKANDAGNGSGLWFLHDHAQTYIGAQRDGARTDIPAIEKDMDVHKALNQLNQSAYGMLPVCENGKLIGVLTYKDLAQVLSREGEHAT